MVGGPVLDFTTWWTDVAGHSGHHLDRRWFMSAIARYVVDAVVLEHRSPSELARSHKVARSWIEGARSHPRWRPSGASSSAKAWSPHGPTSGRGRPSFASRPSFPTRPGRSTPHHGSLLTAPQSKS